MKKLICFVLCVLIAAGAAAVIPVSAADTSNVIYFDANGWTSLNKIYCHMWVIGGADFFGWQTPNEECTKVKGTTFSYDLSKLANSTDVSGGLQSGEKYGVIFSTNTGLQTYDLTFGIECKGDTASLTGMEIENPVDSNRKGYEAVWSDNSGKYGPHLALTSIGNIIGSKLAPGETGIQIIGDWVCTYYESPRVDAVDALAKAMPQFGIKESTDLTDVIDYCTNKEGVSASDLPEIQKTLEDAFYKAYPKENGVIVEEISASKNDISNWTVKGITNKTYTGKPIKQIFTVEKNGQFASYKVQYVDNIKVGKAIILITGTGEYTGSIIKTFMITKAANKMKVKTSAKTVSYSKLKRASQTVSPIKVTNPIGKVTYKKISGSSKFSINSNGKITVKAGASKKSYTLAIKITANGNSNYKPLSKTVKVKVTVK